MLSGITAKTAFRLRRRSDGGKEVKDKPDRSKASSSRNVSVTEDQAVEAAALGELNLSLEVLAEVFPNIQVEVFREMLLTFSHESRLQLITEALLSKKDKHVKGRWLSPGQQMLVAGSRNADGTATAHVLEARDRFRSSAYREAARETLCQEFKGLSRSSVKAVLAENSGSYTLSRPVLLDLVTKSWRYALTNLFGRRKIPPAQEHPLIEWRDLANGHRNPILKPTASEELNEELEQTVMRPLLEQLEAERTGRDKQYAEELNEREAEEAGALHDCACCFVPSPFERLSSCAASGHLICFSCIRHTFNEALYGQGWAAAADEAHGSLLCIAVGGGGGGQGEPRCASFLPPQLVRRAVHDSTNGAESWRKFEHRLAANNIAGSQLPVSSCPACCYYAEVEPPAPRPPLHTAILALLGARLPRVPFPLSVVLLIPYILYFAFSVDSSAALAYHPLHLVGFLLALAVAVNSLLPFAHHACLLTMINAAAQGQQQQQQQQIRSHNGGEKSAAAATANAASCNGRKFVCRNPACLRRSCLRCRAAWRDPHTCFTAGGAEGEEEDARAASLRLFVDAAATHAATRTCPQCALAFVKESGCNKMTCPRCGYALCWVCRAQIKAREGYGHFCPHFRPEGDGGGRQGCPECTRCDLYRSESEGSVVERVRREAEAEWWERERERERGMESGVGWGGGLEDGVAG